ncbi:MAG TPA: PfkB family carbohydrate kinase, partial [Pseudonocardiaceae bacterium]
MTDVLTFGETMAVLRAVEPGPLRLAGSLRLGVAGAESTVAIGLARLGHAARWVGRVGDDEFGRLVLDRLRAETVDITHASTDDAPTGLLVREQRTADLARVRYYRTGSAGSRLSVGDLVPALADGARLLLLSGITPALSTSALAATRAAVARGRVGLGGVPRRQLPGHVVVASRRSGHAAAAGVVGDGRRGGCGRACPGWRRCRVAAR